MSDTPPPNPPAEPASGPLQPVPPVPDPGSVPPPPTYVAGQVLTAEQVADILARCDLASAAARANADRLKAEKLSLEVQKLRLETEHARAVRLPSTPLDALVMAEREPRQGEMPTEPNKAGWDRTGLAGLSPKEARVIELWLLCKPRQVIAKEVGLTVPTLDGWLRKDHMRRAMALGQSELGTRRFERLRRLFDTACEFFSNALETDENAIDVPEVRAAVIDAKAKAATMVFTRLKPFTVGELTADAAIGVMQTEEQWRRQYLEPERILIPHKKQRAVLRSVARYVVVVAGAQGGKSVVIVLLFWLRVMAWVTEHETGDRGFFWILAPNAIVGQVICERFVKLAPPGWIVDTEGGPNDRTWTLKDGSRVQFRTAVHADQLVAVTVHGALVDEFTLCKADVWRVSLRQRFAATGGWAILGGTPRGRNWTWSDIWAKTIDGATERDTDFEGHTWHTSENPAVDPKEVEAARRQLPAAYFRREWEADWGAFHGQIYEDWNEETMTVDHVEERVPRGTRHVAGIDWGFAAPGCVLIVRVYPNDIYEVVDEVYASGRLDEWWDERIAEKWREWKVVRFHADPEDAEHIASLADEGIPIEAAHNEVQAGIKEVAKLIRQGRLLVSARCVNLLTQLPSYRWKEAKEGGSKTGESLEIPQEGADHALDALRYAIFSELTRGLTPEERTSWRGRRLDVTAA